MKVFRFLNAPVGIYSYQEFNTLEECEKARDEFFKLWSSAVYLKMFKKSDYKIKEFTK
jgi:hypothetical protein